MFLLSIKRFHFGTCLFNAGQYRPKHALTLGGTFLSLAASIPAVTPTVLYFPCRTAFIRPFRLFDTRVRTARCGIVVPFEVLVHIHASASVIWISMPGTSAQRFSTTSRTTCASSFQ